MVGLEWPVCVVIYFPRDVFYADLVPSCPPEFTSSSRVLDWMVMVNPSLLVGPTVLCLGLDPLGSRIYWMTYFSFTFLHVILSTSFILRSFPVSWYYSAQIQIKASSKMPKNDLINCLTLSSYLYVFIRFSRYFNLWLSHLLLQLNGD